MKRIFSGIKPSGDLTIGNYLGAIKNWIKLQEEYDSIFCVVDLHAITVPQNPALFNKRSLEIARIYLAAGIDPQKSAIFLQSHVPEHSELAWILNTLAKMSEMERMTQFKDKSRKGGRESSNVGLFDYPVLMAADILLYDTQIVPVGADQLQHIEIARALANRFNKKFGNTFVIPEPFITKESMRIMSLDDPKRKMDKSAESKYNFIALRDDAETVRHKIKKAVTDSGSEIVYADDKPALKNLLNIYSALTEKPTKKIEAMYAGKGYADFKNDLAEIIINFLTPLQTRMSKLTDEKVLKILRQGAEKVRPIAKSKLNEVKKKVGFVL